MKTSLVSLGLWVFGTTLCQSQGFLNLNFESAHLSGYAPGDVPSSAGIPGWTVYDSSGSGGSIVYNTIALDDPVVTIQGINSTELTPLQGNYSVYIQGGSQWVYGTNVGILQTGQIPISAKSLTFWGYASNMQLSFSGQALAYNSIGSTGNYTIFGADISAFAGHIGELRFNVTHPGGATLDNIQFSNSPVPEPGTVALLVAGGLLGAWRWKRS